VKIDIDAQLMGLPTYPKQARIGYHFGQRGELPPVTVTWYDGGRARIPLCFPQNSPPTSMGAKRRPPTIMASWLQEKTASVTAS